MVCGAESSAGDVGKAASYNDVAGQVDVSQTLSLPFMDAIAAFDYRLFRFVNEGWVSPFLDFLMPFLSGNDFFRPILALVAGGLLWKGGRRGRCFVLILVLTLALGEYGTGRLKKAIERPRPFITHLETRMLAGKGLNASMPSGHAAIWAAAAVVSSVRFWACACTRMRGCACDTCACVSAGGPPPLCAQQPGRRAWH